MVSDLKELKKLSTSMVELLGAVGVEDLESLAQNEVQGLHEEIVQANGHLEVVEKVPTKKELGVLIKEAQKISKKRPQAPVVRLEEEVPSISSLPVALAVKKEQIVKSKIAVADVPVMENFVEEITLSEHVARETKVAQKAKNTRKEKIAQRKSKEEPLDKNEVVRDLSKKGSPNKKANPLGGNGAEEEKKEKRPVVEPLERNAGFDIRKTASPELNAGKKLHSRSYVRGVLHPQAGRVKVAAVISLITLLLLPASFVAGALVIFKDSVPFHVSLWVLAIPATFLIFGFFYMVIARPMKCRICGQPALASKSCRRHVKAHRRLLLGYILPTSLHMLLFHWFRCIYCGTSVRLKE